MKKYVLVGTGQRGTYSYIVPLTKEMQDCVKLCGVYDKNIKRAKVGASKAAYPVEVFDDFDKMLNTVKPDVVIVTSIDATHHEYIIRSLEFGCDVVSEKPVTTDEDKMNAIFEAEKRTGHKVTITFNCRFSPAFMRVKELIRSGVIGTPLSVHYEWLLDTDHGADYFRRWHRERKNSGSLLIHKSTHHFDVMNWILDDEPVKVNAFGTKRFYGPTRANHGVRCKTCQYKDECEFYFDLDKNEKYKELYSDCEDVDGYFRDGCVFSENVDIEDSVSLNISYKKGTVCSYSLTTHSPIEGARFHINGTKGRIELFTQTTHEGLYTGSNFKKITVYNRLGEKIEFEPNMTETMVKYPGFGRALGGGHGGSDMLLCDMVFRGTHVENDELGLLADSRAGAMSIGIGVAANKSMKENRAVEIKELYDFLKEEN